jgi:hypothetical protein
MSYIDREHDEVQRRLDQMTDADDGPWRARFEAEVLGECEEFDEDEFRAWQYDRIAEEVREDRMEGEAA